MGEVGQFSQSRYSLMILHLLMLRYPVEVSVLQNYLVFSFIQ